VRIFFSFCYSSTANLGIRRLAAEYGLQPVFKETFHSLFELFSQHPDYSAMLSRMGVVNEANESELTEEQWEIADVYVAFAFVKQ
jgi:mRNA (guanine-N7-)-methyltransferase